MRRRASLAPVTVPDGRRRPTLSSPNAASMLPPGAAFRSNQRTLSTTAAAFLNRRAWNRSVRTEDAAIAILRFQSGTAALAIVEELTRI